MLTQHLVGFSKAKGQAILLHQLPVLLQSFASHPTGLVKGPWDNARGPRNCEMRLFAKVQNTLVNPRSLIGEARFLNFIVERRRQKGNCPASTTGALLHAMFESAKNV